MPRIRVGVLLFPQHTTYATFAEAVCRAEDLGVDTIWDWDHFFPYTGDPDGMHLEGWTLLTAMAMLTHRAEIGCLVTCNSYRNPNLLADMARTIDHISGGRLICGIGAGWFERDYTEYDFEFGTPGSRLQNLGRSLSIIKERWQKLNPPPLRNPLPLLVGGGGEKVTLRLAAQYATMWNGFGPAEAYAHKNQVLTNWCHQLGRDPLTIERTVSITEAELTDLDAFVRGGAQHIILDNSAPFDMAPLQHLIDWRNAHSAE